MAGFTLSSMAGNQWVFFVTYGIGIGTCCIVKVHIVLRRLIYEFNGVA